MISLSTEPKMPQEDANDREAEVQSDPWPTASVRKGGKGNRSSSCIKQTKTSSLDYMEKRICFFRLDHYKSDSRQHCVEETDDAE